MPNGSRLRSILARRDAIQLAAAVTLYSASATVHTLHVQWAKVAMCRERTHVIFVFVLPLDQTVRVCVDSRRKKKHGMTVPAVWGVRQLLDNPHWVRATEATDPLESAVGTIGAFVSIAKPNPLVTANGRLLEHNDDDLLGQHGPEILAGYGSYSLPCDKPMSRGSSMDEVIRTPVTPVSIPSTEPAITDPVSVPELASSASLSPRRDAAR